MPLTPERRTILVVWLALALGLAATLWLWRFTADSAEAEARSAFEQRARYASLAIERVSEELATALRGMRAFIEVLPGVDAAEFQRHVESLNLRLFASGLQYLGYLERGALGCEVRADCFAMKHVYPPATNRSALGVDLAQIAGRRDALARAIDSGYLAATEPVEPAADNIAEPGLILYLAVYRPAAQLGTLEDRRAALLGIVTAAFSLEDLVRGEVGGRFFEDTRVRVRDIGLVSDPIPADAGGRVLLESAKLVRRRDRVATEAGTVTPRFVRTIQREFAGRNWRVELAADADRFARTAITPVLVLALGVIASALLFAYLQIVARARFRAEALAQRMTEDLREREERLRQALDAANMGAWELGADAQAFRQDARAAELMVTQNGGFDALVARMHPADRDRVRERVAAGSDLSVECRMPNLAGEERWVELSARFRQGGAFGLVRDITERKRQADARRALALRLVTAQEEERQQIARELHDQMGQDITALALGMRHLAADPGRPAADRDLLGRLDRIVTSVDRQVDKFMVALRPLALDDHGLEAALTEHVANWSTIHRVRADLHVRGITARLPFSVESTLYRVVQEALTNIAKHARASHVGVVIEERQDYVQAIIEDDGAGFEIERTDARAYGLVGMRERVELLDGELKIESTRGIGTTVYARLPLERKETTV